MAVDYLGIINDENTYSDSMEITAPNGEKTDLGSLRKAFHKQQANNEKRAGELDAQDKAIKRMQTELANVYATLAAEKEDFAQRRAHLEDQSKGRKLTSFEENFVDATKERIDALGKAMEQIAKNQQTVSETQVKMAESYLNTDWERTTARLAKNAPEGVKITKELLLETAKREGFKDGNGILDLDRAYDKITEPNRMKAMVDEAEKKGYQKAKEEEVLRAIGRPSITRNPAGSGTEAAKSFGTLEKAFDAAMEDSTISRMLTESVQ